MVDSEDRAPGRRRMAIFANDTGIHVIGVPARGNDAVVAFITIPGDIHMIKIRRHPGHCCMAVVAVIAAGDMVLTFTFGNYAVMAGAATAQYLRVIDNQYGHE